MSVVSQNMESGKNNYSAVCSVFILLLGTGKHYFQLRTLHFAVISIYRLVFAHFSPLKWG